MLLEQPDQLGEPVLGVGDVAADAQLTVRIDDGYRRRVLVSVDPS